MKRRLTNKGFGINLRIGTQIVGKWQENRYTIIRKLGSGMVGSVYLCDSNGKRVALKISRQPLSMTKEVNVLQSLNKAQDKTLGPYLLDVDDWEVNQNQAYSFYVMEYINGVNFTTFMRGNGSEWIGVIFTQLLDQLHHLHKLGWVFGDLKVENLMVEQHSKKVRFVDVGGTTKLGRSIKEFTEFYDRGYWGLGTRRAEPSYDLFALVMVLLTLYYPNHFQKRGDSIKRIDEKINGIKDLDIYRFPLKKAIRGKYSSTAQMKQEWVYSIMKKQKGTKEKGNKWVEPMLILVLANLFYFGSVLLF